jgi:PAS domain S-box-containing protein
VHVAGPGTGWERLFWLVFERSSNPIALVDEDRRYVEVNDAWAALVDHRREELAGAAVDTFIKPSQRAQAAREWREFLQSGEYAAKRELIRADGSEVDLDFAARLSRLGDRRFAIYVALRASNGRHPASRPRPRERDLSNREREIITLIALGRETQQIAAELGIAVETVRTHVRNAMSKLHAHTRAQLVAIALCGRDIMHPDCVEPYFAQGGPAPRTLS